jgi:hypothetical protein
MGPLECHLLGSSDKAIRTHKMIFMAAEPRIQVRSMSPQHRVPQVRISQAVLGCKSNIHPFWMYHPTTNQQFVDLPPTTACARDCTDLPGTGSASLEDLLHVRTYGLQSAHAQPALTAQCCKLIPHISIEDILSVHA